MGTASLHQILLASSFLKLQGTYNDIVTTAYYIKTFVRLVPALSTIMVKVNATLLMEIHIKHKLFNKSTLT